MLASKCKLIGTTTCTMSSLRLSAFLEPLLAHGHNYENLQYKSDS